MRRRMGGVLVALLVASGVVVVEGVSPAGAAKPVITPTGDLACSGSGKFKGVSGGGSISGAIRLKMACVGSTGHPGVTVRSAKAKPFFSSDCSGTGTFGMTVTWGAKGGRITPTYVQFTGLEVTPTGWSGPSAEGTSDIGGSWGGPDSASIIISGPGASLLSTCQQPVTKASKIVSFASVTLFL